MLQITMSMTFPHPKNSELNMWNTEVDKRVQLMKKMIDIIEIQPAIKEESLDFTRNVRELKRTLARKQWYSNYFFSAEGLLSDECDSHTQKLIFSGVPSQILVT